MNFNLFDGADDDAAGLHLLLSTRSPGIPPEVGQSTAPGAARWS